MGSPTLDSTRKKKAAAAATTVQLEKNREKERLRREDHLRVKHDKLFSDWKILLGPSDWKNHASGEEGSQRYRLHNLPSTYFGPGVYELGLTRATLVSQEPKQRNLRRDAVVVVYLGQADNVRQRLQRYGQSGSHLEGTRSGSVQGVEENDFVQKKAPESFDRLNKLDPQDESKEAISQGGLRLFTTVFSHGYSIAFRWARTESKQMAEKVEAELLHVFDYPWNSSLNGARRPSDILAKLELLQYNLERNLCLGRALGLGSRKWEYFGRKVGISVAVRRPMEEGSSIPRLKFSLCWSPNTTHINDEAENGASLCGVLLEDGSLCRSLPVKGRKRCSAHKGFRAKRIQPDSAKAYSNHIKTSDKPTVITTIRVKGKRVEISDVSSNGGVCGVTLDGGSSCLNPPVKGRKRCSDHKGIPQRNSLN